MRRALARARRTDPVPASPADDAATMQPVKVAVIDVGSNSVRLLVASVGKRGLKQLHRDRVYVRLGDDAYALGRIGRAKLEETREGRETLCADRAEEGRRPAGDDRHGAGSAVLQLRRADRSPIGRDAGLRRGAQCR